jgi:hypothetical protein
MKNDNKDTKQIQDPTDKAVPSDLSDHDERDEGLAVEKHWDQESNDALAKAEQHLAEFKKDGVPLSAEDWEKEEENDDEIPDHIEGAVDESLEDLAAEELEENNDADTA